MESETSTSARPFAGWSSVGFGLVALAFALWVLFDGDVFANLDRSTRDEPFLMVALVNGIIGTLAGVVALARGEPTRLALVGLAVSLVAVLAKVFMMVFAVSLGVVILVVFVGALVS